MRLLNVSPDLGLLVTCTLLGAGNQAVSEMNFGVTRADNS